MATKSATVRVNFAGLKTETPSRETRFPPHLAGGPKGPLRSNTMKEQMSDDEFIEWILEEETPIWLNAKKMIGFLLTFQSLPDMRDRSAH